MKFSTLKRSDYSATFVDVTGLLYSVNGNAINSSYPHGLELRALVIINASGGDLVFAINSGSPFKVLNGITFEYGLGAQGTAAPLLKLEVNAANLSGVTIFGQ